VKLYEYQAKSIFKKTGIPVPKGRIVTSLEMVSEAFNDAGGKIVIKAQVLTGGRGKAGGIKGVDTIDEAKKIAISLLGSKLKGLEVKSLLFEERLDIAREYYVAIVNDRERSCPLAMLSMKGGMAIEEVAKEYPDQLAMQPIDILYGLEDYQIRMNAFHLGVPFADINPLVSILKRLYEVYRCNDAELTEINPLIMTQQGQLIAGDGRLNIDDNSLFRHPELKQYIEVGVDKEFKAKKGNAFIDLDGDIGVMCTGAGMTMTMMDQISAYGGKPADFMDVGWGMLEGAAEEGIKLLLAKGVKVILISTYSGGRTDIMAERILEGLPRIRNLNVPVVIRLQGKNEAQAQKLLSECQLPYVRTAETLDKAVALAVQIAKGEVI
jgi:succinyl-CoA synthetase beta subunit